MADAVAISDIEKECGTFIKSVGKTGKRKTSEKPKKGRAKVDGVSPVKRVKHGGSGKASSRADPVAILESPAHAQTDPDTAGPFARNMDNLTVNSASTSTAGSIHAEQALADQPSKPADQAQGPMLGACRLTSLLTGPTLLSGVATICCKGS